MKCIKKLVALTLAAVLALAMLTACGGTPSVPEETEETKQVVDNINAVRTENGLPALKTIPAATDVANKIAALREKQLLNLISEEDYRKESSKLYSIQVDGKKFKGSLSINSMGSCEENITKEYCQRHYDENNMERVMGKIMRSSDLMYVAVANRKMSNGKFVSVVIAY